MRDRVGSITVLHVEDDSGFADLTAEYLPREDERLSVETATDVTAALEGFAPERIDCIVSDYELPDRTGIEFLQAVRNQAPDIPFILFTGHGSEGIASEAISSGVTDYLQKETGTDQYTILANRITNAVRQTRAEQTATETQRRLTELARNSNDILWMFTADWSELLFINDAYEDIWGRPTEQLAARPRSFLDSIHSDDRADVEQAMDHLSGGRRVDIEFRVGTPDGDLAWVWVKGEPITDADGAVVRVAGFVRDISDRKRRERVLEELHAVTTELPAYDTDEAICRRIVAAAESILEFDMCVTNLEVDGQLIVTAASQNVPEEGTAVMSVEEGLAGKTYRTGESFRIDDVQASAEANPQGPYRSALSIPMGDHGVFQTVSETRDAFDATDRELAELLVSHATRELDRLAYERRLSQYETIVEASSDAIYAVNSDGQYTLVNEAFADLTGYARSELLGMPPSAVLDEASYERSVDAVRTFLADSTDTTQRTQEITVVTAAGERVPCEDSLALLPLEDGQYRGVAGIVRDISERKARERELKRYETMANAAGDMVYLLDTDGYFQFVNDATEDVTGYTRDELLGTHINTLADESDIEAGESVLRGLRKGGRRATETFRWTLTTADGDERPVESQISLLYEGNEVIASVGVVRDVTDRIARERELERRNERLEAFTSIASHDLRNPLNVATGRLELARDDCDNDNLDDVAHALERMDTLIDDLLTLARNGEEVGTVEEVAVATAAKRAWRSVATSNATLAVETDRRILADRSRLDGLFENLLRNAVQHGSTGSQPAANGPGAREGVAITVGDLDDGFYVADTGPGIPESERGRVFERGYSTSDDGIGFGLAIVQEIAEAHGWSISLTESASGGACFEITGVETVT